MQPTYKDIAIEAVEPVSNESDNSSLFEEHLLNTEY